jgi:hypothetical protein
VGSSAGAVAQGWPLAAQALPLRLGGRTVLAASAGAYRRSGQWHRGAVAVAAAATATAAAVAQRAAVQRQRLKGSPWWLVGQTVLATSAAAHWCSGQQHRGVAAVAAAATATAAAAAVAQRAAVQPHWHRGGPLWLGLCHHGSGGKQCWRHLRRLIIAAVSGIGAQRQWQQQQRQRQLQWHSRQQCSGSGARAAPCGLGGELCWRHLQRRRRQRPAA